MTRLGLPDAPFTVVDALAVPVVAVGWSFQEWAIHKYLLHGLKVKRVGRNRTSIVTFFGGGCFRSTGKRALSHPNAISRCGLEQNYVEKTC